MEFLRFEIITEVDTVYLSDELIPSSNVEAALTVTNPSVRLPNFSPLSKTLACSSSQSVPLLDAGNKSEEQAIINRNLV